MLASLTLNGRRALVTGGGSGLGRAIAIGLAEAGAGVVVCGRHLDTLAETVSMVVQGGGTGVAIEADVTVEADVLRLREEAGPIDVLVNNAGIAAHREWSEMPLEEWHTVMAVDLDAPFRLCQLFVPPMVERRWGRVINVSSVYGSMGGNPALYPGRLWDAPAYFAAKHGLHGITHYLAPRLAPLGVCVNSLSPGAFLHEANENRLTPETVQALSAAIPAGRLGRGEDLVAAAVFLASPGAQYVTGQNLVVDGGWTVW